jgi:hypothetical protein
MTNQTDRPRYFISNEGWYYGPTTSWLVEWYLHDPEKCECGVVCFGWDCKGIEENRERVFSEAAAVKRSAEIVDCNLFFAGPRWIKETLVLDTLKEDYGKYYCWDRDIHEDYQEASS